MPKPIDVVKREIKERIKGKHGSEKIKELRKILDEIPWSVGDYKDIRADINRQIENSSTNIKRKGNSGYGYSFRKESPQVLILGLPNSGKSTFLNTYTRAGAKVGEYPFTTTQPIIGTMMYNDVRIYMIEMPPLFEDSFNSDKRPFHFIRTTDGLLMVINNPEEYLVLNYELEKARIGLTDGKIKDTAESKVDIYKPTLIVYRGEKPPTDLMSVRYGNDNEIKKSIYEILGIKRVYLLDERNNPVLPPVIFLNKDEFTVNDVIKKAGLQRFKNAKIYGNSAKYDGEMVGLEYKLNDGDRVRIIE